MNLKKRLLFKKGRKKKRNIFAPRTTQKKRFFFATTTKQIHYKEIYTLKQFDPEPHQNPGWSHWRKS